LPITGENSNQIIKKRTRLVTRPAGKFFRCFDVSRSPPGDQFPASLFASGIVRISQLSGTSMVFRKKLKKSGSLPEKSRLGHYETLLQSAFRGVKKKKYKK